MTVELSYDADCPNVAATRSVLIRAFTQTGVSARWKEWERGSPESPSYAQDFGSPTILVNGRDVVGLNPSPHIRACRVYVGSDGNLQSTPPVESICAALRNNASTTNERPGEKGRLRAIFASFPAIGTALLPKLTCPLCWPVYAAALSGLGLGFVDYTPYLLPLTVVFLALTIGILVMNAKRTRRWVPLLCGAVGAALILLGKFTLELDWLNTLGIGLLVIAVLISTRQRTENPASCPACVTVEREIDSKAS